MILDLDFVLRIGVAGLLGAMVGIEREIRSKEAGLKTHFLVAVGSALIMVVSKYAFSDIMLEEHISLDPSRVATQVVSGVGFLGAGTIIIQKHAVKGLTTACWLMGNSRNWPGNWSGDVCSWDRSDDSCINWFRNCQSYFSNSVSVSTTHFSRNMCKYTGGYTKYS